MKCKFCRYYKPEGSRGGTCSILSDVLVDGHQEACRLSKNFFRSDECAPAQASNASPDACVLVSLDFLNEVAAALGCLVDELTEEKLNQWFESQA